MDHHHHPLLPSAAAAAAGVLQLNEVVATGTTRCVWCSREAEAEVVVMMSL